MRSSAWLGNSPRVAASSERSVEGNCPVFPPIPVSVSKRLVYFSKPWRCQTRLELYLHGASPKPGLKATLAPVLRCLPLCVCYKLLPSGEVGNTQKEEAMRGVAACCVNLGTVLLSSRAKSDEGRRHVGITRI